MHQRQCNTVMCKHCSTSGFNTDIHHQILTELPDYSKRLAVKIGKHFHVHHQAQQQQRPATVRVRRRRRRRNLATTSTHSASSSSAPRLAFCYRYLSSRLSSTVVDNGPLLPGIVEAAVERRRRVRRQRRSVQTRRMIMVRQRSMAR